MGSITDFQNIIIPTTGERLNEESFVHCMELLKTIDITEFNPPSWLKHLESPLEWIQVLTQDSLHKSHIDNKLQDYPNEDHHGIYTFEKFCLHLAKICQNVLMKNYKDAVVSLQQLRYVLSEISRNNSDEMYLRIEPAFKHVLLVFEANISFLNNELNEEDFNNCEVYSNLKMALSKMEQKVKGGIEAIKGRFYLSIASSTNIAKACMQKANELDPEFHAWIYWTGKIIRKQCKRDRDRDFKEELRYFELAVEKKRDPKYLLYLAQCYREKSTFMNYKVEVDRDEQNMFNEKSLELYRECWELKKDSAAINRRLGNGVMSLYKRYADYNLAEQALLSALAISNRPTIFHMLGRFYLKHKKDYSNAIQYFIQGAENGLYNCFNQLIRLKYIMCDPEYDPYEDLKKQETAIKYSEGLWVIYSDLFWYYLSIKCDLPKAVEYFFKIQEIEDYTPRLTKFRCYTFLLDQTVNICAILMEEVNRNRREGESNDEIFGRLNRFFSENPDLLENNDLSLSSIEEELLNKKLDQRQGIEGSFQKNHRMQSNWKREPVNNRSYAYNRRTYSERSNTENWRAECSHNEFVANVPNVKK